MFVKVVWLDLIRAEILGIPAVSADSQEIIIFQ